MADEEHKLVEQPPTSSSDEDASLVGTTFAARYEIEQCIGQGGMGVVYLAKHTSLGRKVVIKTLINTVTEEGRRRFEREARQLSSLSHSNIVTLYDFGYEGDTAYIVMEYVEGHTLKELIHSGERMSAGTFFRLAIQIADAVGEAHSRGMLHRDLKPANIMLTQARGEPALVKVLDFGLAKLKSSNIELTKEGNLVGSVSYVPPEHILGDETQMSADVYSLGVVFYYMLAGVKPFDGKDEMSVLYQHVHDAPPALSEAIDPSQQVPDSTVELIHECLSKKPSERPANADELLQRLLNEVNVASLHMPLSSGEITRLTERKQNSRGRAMPGDHSRDSGLWTDEYVHTPTNLVTSRSGAVSNGFDLQVDGESSSISTSQILENSALLQVQVRRTRWLIGLMLLVLVGGGAAILVLQDKSEDSEQVAQQRVERLRQRLDDVESKLSDGDFGPAELILEGLKSELVDHPKLLDRAADYRDQIIVGRLVLKGERHTAAEEWSEAHNAYKKVLDVQPAHAEAQAKVDELGAKISALDAAKTGTLEVTATPVAEVFIDDVLAGQTPLTQNLEPGSHEVELRASAHEPWTDRVTIDADSTLRISPVLRPANEDTPSTSAPRARRPQRGSAPKPRRTKAATRSKSTEQEVAVPAKPKPKRSPAKQKGAGSDDSLFGVSGDSRVSEGDNLFEGSQQPEQREFDLLDDDSTNAGGKNADFLD